MAAPSIADPPRTHTTFLQIFSDPLQGDYTQVMLRFHDNHAPDSEAMYNIVTGGGDLGYPYAYIGMFEYRNEECGRSLILHSMAKHPLSFVRQTEWGGNAYAFVQDVVEGQINSVPITEDYFQRTRNDLYTNAPRAIERVSELFAADPNLQLLEPFRDTEDADLRKLRTRFLMLVPPRYVPIVLNRRLTPRELWTELVGAIVAAGDLEICSPLVEWVLLACLRTAPGAPSSVRLPAPHPPLGDADFIQCRQGTLYWHLPMLRPVVMASLNQSYFRKIWNFVSMNRLMNPTAEVPEPPQNEPELARYIVDAKIHALWKEDHVAVEDEEDAVPLGAALLENKQIEKVDVRLGHNFTRPAAEALARAIRLSNISSFSLQLPQKTDRDYQEEKLIFFQALAPLRLQQVLLDCCSLTNQDARQLGRSLDGKRLVKFHVELGPEFNEQGATDLSIIIRNAQSVLVKRDKAPANVQRMLNRAEREKGRSMDSNIQRILYREGIERSETMQSMNLQFMSAVNAMDLAAVLPSLHAIRMECCGSYEPEIQPRTRPRRRPIIQPGIQELSTALLKSNRLESLHLENCYFGDDSLKLLLDGIKHNRSIVRLTLASMAIGNAEIQAFCENWSEDSCIQDMVLTGNHITVVGARQLLGATVSHPKLKSLDLSSNHSITNRGLQTLAEDILPQLTLRLLKLGSCDFLFDPHVTPDQRLDQKTKMSLAMLQAARKNVRMHFLLFNVDDILPQVDAEIAVLLSTNRLGRFILRDTHGLGPAIWAHVFAKRKDDPNVIFCFLREQPTLAMLAQKIN